MKRSVFYAFCLLLSFTACKSKNAAVQNAQESKENIIWVNSSKIDCESVGVTTCFQVKKDAEAKAAIWELLYADIEGFDYEPGHLYKLKVSITELDPEKVPADASTKQYKLIEVIEKKLDERLAIHDIWVLQTIVGETYQLDSDQEQPRIEFNLNKGRMMGKGVCNSIGADLKVPKAGAIEIGPIITTKMACPNYEVESKLTQALSQAVSYKVVSGTLSLHDKEGQELLNFKKVD